jgi:alkanesulfonate monooxygenase SsuD/methylene tetrahydromethanopterin reductase-like flavin-dependent oxidoreductase (luciferase family)
MLGLVARWADAWNMWGLPATIAERAAALDRACERIGRDPATIRRSAQALVMLTDDRERAAELVRAAAPRAVVAGPATHLADVVAEWQAVGVDEVIVPDFVLGTGSRRLDAMNEIIESVAPSFRS